MDVIIRESCESDGAAISDLAIAAFGESEGPVISALIEDLVADSTARPMLSLVATIDNSVVGHILFTNAVIRQPSGSVSAAILAPLAVHPEVQNQGVGGRLILEGIVRLKAAGVDLVFVLGYPAYYTRYGFTRAGVLGYEAPYPIPKEHSDAWMVQVLRSGTAKTVEARVQCANALDKQAYWQE
jgi:putative acetyltransferase